MFNCLTLFKMFYSLILKRSNFLFNIDNIKILLSSGSFRVCVELENRFYNVIFILNPHQILFSNFILNFLEKVLKTSEGLLLEI